VRGCTKISPGCKHCYAETFAERWRGVKGHPYEQGFDPPGPGQARRAAALEEAADGLRQFSMSDLFHEDVSNEYIAAVFGVMAACPQHTFQILTKRAERLPEWFAWLGCVGHLAETFGNPLIHWVIVGGESGPARAR
jgi:protein gp37